MKMDEILKLADKEGFDNFGQEDGKNRHTTYENNIYYELSYNRILVYSLADIFTNKSFLEAMVKIRNKPCKTCVWFHGNNTECPLSDGKSVGTIKGYQYNCFGALAKSLMKDLIFYNGENAEKIITEFIGSE